MVNGFSTRLHPVLLMLYLLLVSGWMRAEAMAPFSTRSQSPVVGVFGLPAAEPGVVLPPGEGRAQLVVDIANNYTFDSTDEEQLLFDGETYRLTCAVRYAWHDRWEVGVDLPFMAHRRGVFDGFIIDWHNAFGMPQGDRDQAEDNELEFAYIRNGQAVLTLREPAAGISDMQLVAAYQLWRNARASRGVTARAGVKMPTGDPDRLLGSGATDLAARLCGEDTATLASLRIGLSASLGAVFLGEGEVLPEYQRDAALFGHAACVWQPLKWLAGRIQADWHTPFYKGTDIRQLGSWSLQLVSGATITLPGDTYLDIAVVEDPVAETAPDVVFHFALRRAF